MKAETIILLMILVIIGLIAYADYLRRRVVQLRKNCPQCRYYQKVAEGLKG